MEQNSEKQQSIPSLNSHSSIEKQNSRREMLLSTMYGLNNSHTKRIQVGLLPDIKNGFYPAIKLYGNGTNTILLDANAWKKFQDAMPLISLYLDGGKYKTEPIAINNNITIAFTTAYGSKAILISHKESEEEEAASGETVREQDSDCSKTKKRKIFGDSVVMQKATFLGLQNITQCVNAYMEHLDALASSVSECCKYLIQETELLLPKAYINADIIKLTIRGNYSNIERAVQTQIKNLPFLDTYFTWVFLEMCTLYLDNVVQIILAKH